MTNNTYKIETIQDIFLPPPESVARFLDEMKECIPATMLQVELTNHIAGQVVVEAPKVVDWTDDEDRTYTTKFVDENGEKIADGLEYKVESMPVTS